MKNSAAVIVFLLALISPLPCLAQQNGATSADVKASENEKRWDFVIRYGQGGFRDGRSPLNKLGGGQLALDTRLPNSNVALSLSGEYYTNSPNPTHSYEISDMWAVNMLYTAPLADKQSIDYFFGGGVGRLQVPKSEADPEASVTGNLFNLEAGVHYKAFTRFGFYTVGKYLYAKNKIIDFNEAILLIGITYRFSLLL